LGENIGIFCCYYLHKFDRNIGFGEKSQFVHQKLVKIAENCDHIIDLRNQPYDRGLHVKIYNATISIEPF
jgi:hypothetical protein